MEWFPTSKNPKIPTRLIKPKWEHLECNFKERHIWVWLYHPKDGVQPYRLVDRKYDNADKSILMLADNEKYTFERFKYWAYLEIPEFKRDLSNEKETD